MALRLSQSSGSLNLLSLLFQFIRLRMWHLPPRYRAYGDRVPLSHPPALEARCVGTSGLPCPESNRVEPWRDCGKGYRNDHQARARIPCGSMGMTRQAALEAPARMTEAIRTEPRRRYGRTGLLKYLMVSTYGLDQL